MNKININISNLTSYEKQCLEILSKRIIYDYIKSEDDFQIKYQVFTNNEFIGNFYYRKDKNYPNQYTVTLILADKQEKTFYFNTSHQAVYCLINHYINNIQSESKL